MARSHRANAPIWPSGKQSIPTSSATGSAVICCAGASAPENIMSVELTPGTVSMAQLEALYRSGSPFHVAPDAMRTVELSAERLGQAIAGGGAIYRVNTGFGKLASVRIADADLAALQRNPVLSHSAGFGQPPPPPTVRSEERRGGKEGVM